MGTAYHAEKIINIIFLGEPFHEKPEEKISISY